MQYMLAMKVREWHRRMDAKMQSVAAQINMYVVYMKGNVGKDKCVMGQVCKQEVSGAGKV